MNKRMKKIFAAVLLAAMCALLAACVDMPTVTYKELGLISLQEDSVAVVVRNRDETYTVHYCPADASTGGELLRRLAEKGTMPSETEGSWLKSVAELYPQEEAHEYIALYTSRQQDWSAEAGAAEIVIDGVRLRYAGKGVGELTVEAGVVLYFQIETW